MTTHRIWDFRGDQAGIVWFQKNQDGSVRVLRGHVNSGFALQHYTRLAHLQGVDPGSIDYVRPDAHVKNLSGESLFEAMQRFGLNPEVLPTEQWKSPQPFAEAA